MTANRHGCYGRKSAELTETFAENTRIKKDPDNNRNKSRYFSSSSPSPLVFFFFLLSLFSMLQCYSERDASAHALPEREGVNGWRDEEERWSVCTCVCYGEVGRGSAALTRCLSGSVCVFKACVFLQRRKSGRHEAAGQTYRDIYTHTVSWRQMPPSVLKYLCVLIHNTKWYAYNYRCLTAVHDIPTTLNLLISVSGCKFSMFSVFLDLIFYLIGLSVVAQWLSLLPHSRRALLSNLTVARFCRVCMASLHESIFFPGFLLIFCHCRKSGQECLKEQPL